MDNALLAWLGVDAQTENIYRHLLSVQDADVVTVAERFEMPQERAREALVLLHRLGLLNSRDGTDVYFAVDPRHSLRPMAEQHERAIRRVHDSLGPLGEIFEATARTKAHGTNTRLVAGTETVGDLYYRLKHRASREFMSFDRPPYLLASNEDFEGATLRRGVRIRAIYAGASFEVEGYWDTILATIALGEEARTLPHLPVKLAVADRAAAMISVDVEGDRREFLYTESPSLLRVLSDYFEAQWALAVPISGETSPAHRSGPRSAGRLPTRDERHLLALFATGLKDEAIAQQLGISSRTLRRRVTTLFTELGVSNRFSAGVAAARRGWV